MADEKYKLRWGGHPSTFLKAFEQLLYNEDYTDVTLACEAGSTIKCHKVVLAAFSPYFKGLFSVDPNKHTVIIIRDVKFSDIKAILDFMYKGEVDVAHDQISSLIKIGEDLKVKGLTYVDKLDKERDENEEHLMDHSPSTTTSNNNTMHHPNHISNNNASPPITSYQSPNNYNSRPQDSRIDLPLWTVPGLPLSPHPSSTKITSMLSSSELSPLERKKLSSFLMGRDTPILRTVLGQSQADSSHPVSLLCHPDQEEDNNENERPMKRMKKEPFDDQSPYALSTPMSHEENKAKPAIPSSSPQLYSHEMRRYKQYTTNDIISAIEAVKNGMSALQAAKLYNVPSRTLYDKVKKMGITTNRPFKRSSSGGSKSFPYVGRLSETDEGSMTNNSAMAFLQHAFDSRGGDERGTLAAIAAAAAVDAIASGRSVSPSNHLRTRSPSPSPTLLKYIRRGSIASSPTPGSDRHYINSSSERDQEDDEGQVEDLSMKRKYTEESHGVIRPPLNQCSSVIKTEETSMDGK